MKLCTTNNKAMPKAGYVQQMHFKVPSSLLFTNIHSTVLSALSLPNCASGHFFHDISACCPPTLSSRILTAADLDFSSQYFSKSSKLYSYTQKNNKRQAILLHFGLVYDNTLKKGWRKNVFGISWFLTVIPLGNHK